MIQGALQTDPAQQRRRVHSAAQQLGQSSSTTPPCVRSTRRRGKSGPTGGSCDRCRGSVWELEASSRAGDSGLAPSLERPILFASSRRSFLAILPTESDTALETGKQAASLMQSAPGALFTSWQAQMLRFHWRRISSCLTVPGLRAICETETASGLG